MAESIEHIRLVNVLLENLPDFITDEMKCFLLYDLPTSTKKPPLLFLDHRPDLFVEHSGTLFLGEAKTKKDIYRPHSISQYDNYLKYCSLFTGQSYFSIIVPWDFFISIKNYFKRLKIKKYNNVNIMVYNDLGYWEMI